MNKLPSSPQEDPEEELKPRGEEGDGGVSECLLEWKPCPGAARLLTLRRTRRHLVGLNERQRDRERQRDSPNPNRAGWRQWKVGWHEQMEVRAQLQREVWWLRVDLHQDWGCTTFHPSENLMSLTLWRWLSGSVLVFLGAETPHYGRTTLWERMSPDRCVGELCV